MNLDPGPNRNTNFFPDLDAPMVQLQSDPLRPPPFHFDADPDPAFHFDADAEDPAVHFDAYTDADPDPDPTSQN